MFIDKENNMQDSERMMQKKTTNQFIAQLNRSVAEDLSVARVAATEDTHGLELAFGVPFLHSKSMLSLLIFNSNQNHSSKEQRTKKRKEKGKP